MRSSATASLPRKPIAPAAATAPSWAIGCGFCRRSSACQPAEQRARQDHAHDRDAGEVLDPPESEREARARRAAGEAERDPERERRRGVAHVVDRIGEQRHAAGEEDDRELDERGQREQREGPRDRAHAARGRDRHGIGDEVRVSVLAIVGVAAHRGSYRYRVIDLNCSITARSLRRPWSDRRLEAVIDVIVDQRGLRALERADHRVKLLRDVDAFAAGLDHRDDVPDVTLGALQPVDDRLVGAVAGWGLRLASWVGHAGSLSPPGG